jgi:RNA polymerase sigma-70 factor (ECF subfamily)
MRGAAFERLYRDFGADVLAFCLRRSDVQVAEDVTAETFLVAWRRFDEIPRERRGWLLGVARRLLANHRRGVRRSLALHERLRSTSDRGWEEAAAPPTVIAALACLSDLDQEALLLAAWDGLTSKDAARVLGCTPIAFRLRLHRARRRLSLALDRGEEGHGLRLHPEETT